MSRAERIEAFGAKIAAIFVAFVDADAELQQQILAGLRAMDLAAPGFGTRLADAFVADAREVRR